MTPEGVAHAAPQTPILTPYTDLSSNDRPMLTLNSKHSTAARKVTANPITGTVRVTFTSGPAEYRFTGV